jgi:RHS repeat-associated protein
MTRAEASKRNYDTKQVFYYGFRYYDPETGRWPSRDPIREQGHNLLMSASRNINLVFGIAGLNAYAFSLNQAVNFVDADGRLIVVDPDDNRTCEATHTITVALLQDPNDNCNDCQSGVITASGVATGPFSQATQLVILSAAAAIDNLSAAIPTGCIADTDNEQTSNQWRCWPTTNPPGIA